MEKKPVTKKKLIVNLLISVTLLLVVAGVAAGVYFYSHPKVLGSTTSLSLDDQAVIDQLHQVMLLPDETPSIATVLDKSKLSDQPFFTRAENNDKLILYTQAGKAILYRPATNMIIEVMPLVLYNDQKTCANNLPSTL